MSVWRRQRENVPKQTHVRWLSAEESPFGVPVLDCRPLTTTYVSTSKSMSVAAKFAELRDWDGDGLDGTAVSVAIALPSELQYPFDGDSQPYGPIFKASQMEEKWDLYKHEDRVWFTRSWTGNVAYAAAVSWKPKQWAITELARVIGLEEAPERSVRVVDYLVKSHLYNLAAPHPLKPELKGDDNALALASFNEFGNRALYGTFDDLVGSEVIEKALWGE